MRAKASPIAAAKAAIVLAAGLFAAACGEGGNEVGEFKNDWLGNEIKITALADPDIPGITCHLTHFDRGFWDRVGKGNWFEDPSNSSIACTRTGPVELGGADLGKDGEAVFSQRQSLVFKTMAVRRVIDLDNRAILYVSHSRRPVEGSAKMSLSSVPLTEAEARAAAALR